MLSWPHSAPPQDYQVVLLLYCYKNDLARRMDPGPGVGLAGVIDVMLPYTSVYRSSSGIKTSTELHSISI